MRRYADKPKVRGTGTLFRHSNGPIMAEVDHALCDPAVRRPHQVKPCPTQNLYQDGCDPRNLEARLSKMAALLLQ
jgi:hypothetical protein